ncbi:hypothetical protein Tco_0425773 [Tanacetum coccineum]
MNHQSAIFSLHSDYKQMDQKQYRRESILRWKKKRGNINTHHHTSNLVSLNSFVVTNSTYEPRESSNRPSVVLNEIRVAHAPNPGKNALRFIPQKSDTLPLMPDCPHCGAIRFYYETTNFCCLDGRIMLANNELPNDLKQLLTSTSEDAKAFRTYIRTYNNVFAFTSLGVKSDSSLTRRNKGVYTFRVQGQVAALWVEGVDNGENGSRDIEGIPKKDENQKRKRERPTVKAATLISPHNVTNAEELLSLEQDVMIQKDKDSRFVSVREYYAYKLQEILQGLVDAMGNGETHA